jgi:hypothetical protein
VDHFKMSFLNSQEIGPEAVHEGDDPLVGDKRWGGAVAGRKGTIAPSI